MSHEDHYNDVMGGIGELGKEIPESVNAFFKLHHAALADGALPKATKELLALAIGIAVRCGGCITCHVKDALTSGATPEQVYETIGVAILMGGGPSAVYGAEAAKAVKEFAGVPA